MDILPRHKKIVFLLSIITLFLLITNIISIPEYINPHPEYSNNIYMFSSIMVGINFILQLLSSFLPLNISLIIAGLSLNILQCIILMFTTYILGITIIYLVGRFTKFNSPLIIHNLELIDELYKKKKTKRCKNLVIMINPFISTSSICLKMARSKMPYLKYLFISILGIIPTFIYSIILGIFFRYLYLNNLSLWWFILVVAVSLILLFLIKLLYENIFFKELVGTPRSFMYLIFYAAFHLIVRTKVHTKFERNGIDKLKGPYMLLSNHGSFFDVYFLIRLSKGQRFSLILNKYFCRRKLNRYLLYSFGVIPKKLFSPDSETIKKTIRSIKLGYPILMCPEGRLSVDGTNYQIRSETGKLLKSLKIPVVIATINGAYPTNPKWRKKRIKGTIYTKVEKIITKEEIEKLSIKEINELVNKYISYNDFEYAIEHNLTYKGKDKAKNLESILYYCPKCKQEFTTHSYDDTIECKHCGFKATINDHYSFEPNELNIANIHEWYKIIAEYEREKVLANEVNLTCEVRVTKFNLKSSNYDEYGEGICTMTNEEFKFKGKLNEEEEFALDFNTLKGLPFSAGIQFECYYNDALYYFYPKENPNVCAKWALILDEIMREREKYE